MVQDYPKCSLLLVVKSHKTQFGNFFDNLHFKFEMLYFHFSLLLTKTKVQTRNGLCKIWLWPKQHKHSQIIYFIKEYQSNIDKSGDNHRHHSNLALPSARITLFPIIQRARNGTLIIMGIKIL
jgi:hypothetical protein